jgi:hypothetical protein
MIGPYQTARDFRAALEARLKQTARAQGTDLMRLRRQVAFDRLLARLFAASDTPRGLASRGCSRAATPSNCAWAVKPAPPRISISRFPTRSASDSVTTTHVKPPPSSWIAQRTSWGSGSCLTRRDEGVVCQA